MAHPLAGLDRLTALAEPLVGAWSSRALASTTVGRERALLRAMGVSGLDRDGRPLAWSVVDRWLAGMPDALGAGIALPFAVALLEYDSTPQSLALDLASGAIELAMEAPLLGEPDRRAAAELEVRSLGRAALERIDANRTARGELAGLLGETPRPGLGLRLRAATAGEAIDEAGVLVRAGVDVLRVRVPTGRELAMRLLDLGVETGGPTEEVAGVLGDAGDDPAAAPTGSQRGLAALRVAVDELAAERGAYVRLATAAPALSAPEQAVVAAFERIDMVEADPFTEIVEAGVDPDRALADHAAAHRVLARSGADLCVGPGPLVVAPDLARGLPSDPATRAGRSLALQLLAVRLAVADGIAPEAVAVGALPGWLLGESHPTTRSLAEVVTRSALLPGHPLVLGSPDDGVAPPTRALWRQVAAAVMTWGGGSVELILHPAADETTIGDEHRAAVRVAREVAAAVARQDLQGAAAAHAEATIAAATATLERLAGEGWSTILGPSPADERRLHLGGEAIAERTEGLDLLAPFD